MTYYKQLFLIIGIVVLAVVITCSRIIFQTLNRSVPGEVAGEKIIQMEKPVEVMSTPFVVTCDCEKNFDEPIDVVIEGKVLANFVGGLDFGLTSDKTIEGKNNFYIIDDGQHPVEINSSVRVEGQAAGVTCAYANTVFGECSLEVEAVKVIKL